MAQPVQGLELKVLMSSENMTSCSEFKTSPEFLVKDWGLVDYSQANTDQQKLIQTIYEEKSPGQIIFCHHAPLVTTGRATKEGDLWGWSGKVLQTPRGGRATYHGPNQLVVYPLVNLTYNDFTEFKKRDVTTYLRLLEKIVIETLKTFGIEAYQRCEKVAVENEELEATGVWVDNKKIASIGIAVRRWVTYHGIAINIFDDPKAFQGIKPCGFSSETMTSMEKVTGQTVDVGLLKTEFIKQFRKKIF